MALLDLGLNRAAPAGSTLFSFAQRALNARRQRRALERLDDRALSDIGVTRAQAMAEAGRPIWDVPTTWRC